MVIRQPVRFPYTQADVTVASLMPRLALTLGYGQRSIDILGLLDTGAAVNVLPYAAGIALGAVWDQQRASIPLAGNLGRVEAGALVVRATHPQLTLRGPVRLIFAWVRTDDAPIVLGQTSFFMEFDVCFFRAHAAFEIHSRNRYVAGALPR